MSPRFVYLAWGRPQRPRANLIQTLHTVEALAALGAGVRLYLPPVPAGFDTGGFLAGMGIRRPIDLRPVESLHRRWGGWPFALLHLGELRRAEVVYTRVPELSRVLARLGIRHWLEVHDTEPLASKGWLADLVANQKSRVIRGFVTVSSAGRTALIEAGTAVGHVHTLPNGVDLAAFSTVPDLTEAELCAPRALYVGRISRDRGLPLFEALAATGLPLTLIGPRDHEPATAHDTLELLPAIPHAEVPAALARGALALMPYQADLRHAASISPIKLFEAMAAGRVVIASDLAPIREIIRDGENGLLVPPDEPAAWLAAIERVRREPLAARRMAATARAQAARFTWDMRARRLLHLTTGAGAPEEATPWA
ncbi:MAG: glycosyltransferase [Lysobacterales bacterium]|nr:MAG: glycosyltransferase [Xanthomonadales bacterium]